METTVRNFRIEQNEMRVQFGNCPDKRCKTYEFKMQQALQNSTVLCSGNMLISDPTPKPRKSSLTRALPSIAHRREERGKLVEIRRGQVRVDRVALCAKHEHKGGAQRDGRVAENRGEGEVLEVAQQRERDDQRQQRPLHVAGARADTDGIPEDRQVSRRPNDGVE